MNLTAEAPQSARTPLGAKTQLTVFDMAPFTKEPDRFQKMVAERKKNTAARNERIRTRFNELYNVERKRYDDVVDTLMTEFSVALSTIEKALKSGS